MLRNHNTTEFSPHDFAEFLALYNYMLLATYDPAMPTDTWAKLFFWTASK